MRFLLALLIVTGLLLPRTGAALAELAGFETTITCRGDALVTVTLDGDGAPVETAIGDHGPCLAAALPDAATRPPRTWAHLRPADPSPPADTSRRQPHAAWHGPPPGRAPPAFA